MKEKTVYGYSDFSLLLSFYRQNVSRPNHPQIASHRPSFTIIYPRIFLRIIGVGHPFAANTRFLAGFAPVTSIVDVIDRRIAQHEM